MEGYNGHVRPLDSLVRARGWRLFNVNNLKLARFKEIFPAAAKSDRTRKTLELFQLRDHLPMAGEVLQEVRTTPEENNTLKRLSRRRRRLVNERGRVANALQADLQAVCPGLLEITRDVGNMWFLNFLTCRKGLLKLARVRRASLLKMSGVGAYFADAIQAWQSGAYFAPDASLVGDMIQQDAARILELKQQIKALEKQMARVAENSSIAGQIASIPGYGSVCSAELAGEIGTVERFRNEASLALYLGMATLVNSSGKRTQRSRCSPAHGGNVLGGECRRVDRIAIAGDFSLVQIGLAGRFVTRERIKPAVEITNVVIHCGTAPDEMAAGADAAHFFKGAFRKSAIPRGVTSTEKTRGWVHENLHSDWQHDASRRYGRHKRMMVTVSRARLLEVSP